MDLRKLREPQVKGITDRDVKIVEMLSHGKFAKDIAAKSNISKRTVEDIVLNLLKDFKCRNTPHLVSTFMRKKIIK